MAETIQQIETHIDRTRDELGSHLRELEARVSAATDWREYVRARPYTTLAAAMAGGLVLATVLTKRDPRGASERQNRPSHARPLMRAGRRWSYGRTSPTP